MGRLPNAPLQEVIFEVRWDLDAQDGTNLLHDPKFEIGLGGLRKLVRDRFPEVVRKFHESVPVQLLPHTATWQFRPKPGGWPLIQLGHGVLTVNDTDDAYDWDTVFHPLIKDALAWLEEAYEGAPAYNMAELRYIDSVRIKDHGFTDWGTFVGENLNIAVTNAFQPQGRVVDVGLHQVIELEQGGRLLVAVNSGKRDKDDAMIGKLPSTSPARSTMARFWHGWMVPTPFPRTYSRTFANRISMNDLLDLAVRTRPRRENAVTMKLDACTTAFVSCMGGHYVNSADAPVQEYELSHKAQEALFRLNRFHELKENWDSYGAAVPKAMVIMDARRFVQAMDRMAWSPIS